MLLPLATRLDEADTLCRERLTDEKIKDIVALVPDEWLEHEGIFASKEEHRQAYVQFLTTRLAHSETFVKHAQDAGKTSI